MTRAGQAGRCWPGTGTSPVHWAIHSLTPMQFPLGIRRLCSRQHWRNWHLLTQRTSLSTLAKPRSAGPAFQKGQPHREMPMAFTYTNISPAFTVCMNEGQGLRTLSCGRPSGGRSAEPKIQEGTGTTGTFQVVHLGFPDKDLWRVIASPIWKEP